MLPLKLLTARLTVFLLISAPMKYPAEAFSPYMLGLRPPEVPIFPRSSRYPSSISSLTSLVTVGMLVFVSLLSSAMLYSPSLMHRLRIFCFMMVFFPSGLFRNELFIIDCIDNFRQN